ncbi:MAG: thiamine pyrophosphate-binding protein [Myxococcales bacterium]|nr:thiamine pyrophosphate-binding protein [Myxococcales bacterium]
MNGGELIAEVLRKQGVRWLFTLCGGHISPILVESKRRGIRVVDVRHEVNAVFAADAVARLTGVPGVAAVTAGPGLTNTITAVKNAQMAQSPVVLLGGATATVLKGRGALQDIDQMALLRPHVKWAATVSKVKDLVSALEHAFRVATSGVPGPVFLECPVDLLYEEKMVRSLYSSKASVSGRKPTLGERALSTYLNFHTKRMFAGADSVQVHEAPEARVPAPARALVRRAAKQLRSAERPVLIIGSQALSIPGEVRALVNAVEDLGIPVFLSGMARGLLGKGHALQMRHGRRKALKKADLVLLAGVPCDFRLDYGLQIGRKAYYISANRSVVELFKNRRPQLPVHGDAGRFLQLLSRECPAPTGRWSTWIDELRAANDTRDADIREKGSKAAEQIAAKAAADGVSLVDPLDICGRLDEALADDSILVADGGDFVATASYIVSPRGPLSWLDPGAFGTLGVGAGFAMGAKLVRPDAEVWIVYGDGSVGYSLPEFDTFARHELPVIAVVGNDACWTQIAREQVEILGDDVGCPLARTDYHVAAEGFGGVGLKLTRSDEIAATFAKAKEHARGGKPVLINAHLGTTDFRKGSISI